MEYKLGKVGRNRNNGSNHGGIRVMFVRLSYP